MNEDTKLDEYRIRDRSRRRWGGNKYDQNQVLEISRIIKNILKTQMNAYCDQRRHKNNEKIMRSSVFNMFKHPSECCSFMDTHDFQTLHIK